MELCREMQILVDSQEKLREAINVANDILLMTDGFLDNPKLSRDSRIKMSELQRLANNLLDSAREANKYGYLYMRQLADAEKKKWLKGKEDMEKEGEGK